ASQRCGWRTRSPCSSVGVSSSAAAMSSSCSSMAAMPTSSRSRRGATGSAFLFLALVRAHALIVDGTDLLDRAAPVVTHLHEVEARGDGTPGRGQSDPVDEVEVVTGWGHLDEVGLEGG